MTLRIYYAAAIDNCPDKGKAQLEQFKQLLKKYPIELHGAGIGDSPIIKLDSPQYVKGVVVAHDLREVRECDILLVVLNSKDQAVATFMELEYARQLGLYIIVLILSNTKEKCPYCYNGEVKKVVESNALSPYVLAKCGNCKGEGELSVPEKTKSIFLETFANIIIYSIDELEEILREITNKSNEG